MGPVIGFLAESSKLKAFKKRSSKLKAQSRMNAYILDCIIYFKSLILLSADLWQYE
jgi:hypothetical protein